MPLPYPARVPDDTPISTPQQTSAPTPAPGRWQRLAPVGILGGIALFLPPLGGFALLASMPWLGPWLESHQVPGLLLYITGFIVFAGLALLPTYSQAILAGFAFGIPLGTPAALLGFTGAATVGYFIARRAAGDRLAEAADAEPRLAALRHALLQGSFLRVLGVITLLRLPPNSPFALTNVAFAGLSVPFPAFLLGTLLGMTPRTFVAVVIGAGLEQLTRESIKANLPIVAAGFVVTLVVVAIIGVMARRTLDRMTPPPDAPSI